MHAEEDAPPLSVRLVTPGPWLRLDLDPRTRSGSLARLVNDRLGAADADDPERAATRRELIATLRGFARDATADGAVFAAMLLEEVSGVPVQATVIASYATGTDTRLEPAGGDGIDSADGDLSPIDLRLGEGHRLVCRGELLLVQYAVPVPGLDLALLLSFGSPQVDNVDALLRLFDSIARDARWIFPDRPA